MPEPKIQFWIVPKIVIHCFYFSDWIFNEIAELSLILWWVYVISDYLYHSTRVFSLFRQLKVHHRAVGSSENPIAPPPPKQFRHPRIKKRRKSSRNLNVSVTLVCDVFLNIYISYHSLSYLIVIPTTTTVKMKYFYLKNAK